MSDAVMVYPFRDFLQALKDKDADLYWKLGHLSPSAFWQEWKKVYPEDFPEGGLSLPHAISIVPRKLTLEQRLERWDRRREAFNPDPQ